MSDATVTGEVIGIHATGTVRNALGIVHVLGWDVTIATPGGELTIPWPYSLPDPEVGKLVTITVTLGPPES